MKSSLTIAILLICSVGSLAASAEKLLEDYSEVAIAHIDANHSIEDLIVIFGNKFSIRKLKDEALGHAITHPSLPKKKYACLLLKGAKRAGIASERVIWFRNETQKIAGYGGLRLADLIKLQKSSAESVKAPG